MKKWLKLFFVISLFALISIIVYLILKIFNFDISVIKSAVLNAGNWGILVFSLFFILSLVFLCFVPLLATTLTCLSIYLFGPTTAFFACIISNIIATTVLFFIGDKFGEKIARKIIGEKTFEETQNLMDLKSKILLPILYFVPCVPDEALALISGMTKMKFWYLLLISAIYHSLELGFFIFLGSNLIDWSNLRIIDWLFIANFVVIDYYLIKKLEEKIKNKQK